MADEVSQDQLIDAQNTQRSMQETTNTEQKAPDQARGTVTSFDKDASHDLRAALDRIQLLENGQQELTSLFHQCLANPPEQDQGRSEPNDEDFQSEPKCEIARISNAEWRAMQDLAKNGHPRHHREISLLTVAPKERGDIGSGSQAVEVQPRPLPGSGKPATEASAVHTLGSKTTCEKPYRAILNGRAELMEILGEIFNKQFAPGFYYWFWPFKHLIDHGEKLRVRLSDEESRFRDTDQKVRTEAWSPTADEAEDAFSKANSRLAAMQAPSISQAHAVEVEQEHKEQEPPASQEVTQAGQNPRKFVNESVNREVRADTITTDGEAAPIGTKHSPNPPKPDTHVIDNTRLRDELRCLVTFMDTDLKDVFSVQKDIDNGTRRLIAFDHLWQLYKPGHVVISGKEQKRAYVVLHVTGGRTVQKNWRSAFAKDDLTGPESYYVKYPRTSPFVIDCFYFDFDGTNFGPMPQKFMLEEYEGEVAINSLEVFPIRFDDDPKKTERLLVKRGRKFVKLAGVEHKYYSGPTLRETDLVEGPGEVHGEIIIDFALAFDHFALASDRSRRRRFRDTVFGTGVIADPTRPDERELRGSLNLADPQDKPTFFMEDDSCDQDNRADFLEKTSLLKERSYHEKLPKEVLILLPLRVFGFSLLDRKWFAFDISLVEDIRDSNQGFDQLVIPEDHKKIMQALVRHHTKGPGIAAAETKKTDQEFSMDVIRGKGKGLIILLHGVPGVGKTSTAECVAAQTGRPLFPITCGDIGSTAEGVETRLNDYFDMAHKWGCVLLLDEADVFLARREKGGDLQRNSIVSVFLRVLEYYSGILILTTNRIGEFDEAFSSRIHIKLYYPKLDRKSTLEIWKMNIRRVAESEELGVDVDEDKIKKFARRQWADSAENPTQRWNGRQIRNAFQTAVALAKWDHEESKEDVHARPCLSVKHFEIVAQTSAHFDQYITKMHGIDEGDTWEIMAGRDLLRKNETPRRPASRLVPAAARARTGRRSAAKAETFEDEDEGDETDTDENEEQMRKLEDKLKKMKLKKQGLPDKKLKDPRKESSKKPAAPEVEAEDSSGSSEEEDRD